MDIALTLVRLSGKTEQEVHFKFTGLRQGEKMTEELFYPSEQVCSTSCPKIKRVPSKAKYWPALQAHLDELRATLFVDGAGPICAKLKEIIPEYSYSRNGHGGSTHIQPAGSANVQGVSPKPTKTVAPASANLKSDSPMTRLGT